MIFPMLGDWIVGAMAAIFVGFLDTVAYTLLVVAYNIFDAVAQLDLFGGSTAGEKLYDDITSRIYGIISVVMIFIFAYQLIMLIVDPEGKQKKSQSALIKDTVISIILVIVMPTIFKYMAIFQNHVIKDNTLGAIIMGTGNGDTEQNPGKKVALMTLISFYHPEGTSYSTFYDTDGLKDEATAKSLCEEQTREHSISIGDDDAADVKTCQRYYDALKKWENSNDIAVGSITTKGSLHDCVGDEMEYMWILSTAGALVCAWFFFQYAIDMGTRAVKLGCLQLISPVPVILRIFPQTKKTFETWFGEIKKTYLEVFIRLAVIFFVLELIKLIPTFITILFDANNSLTGVAKGIATVVLILGMLKFAKDAPELFKTLFSNGGNLLSGMNLNPGSIKKPFNRIEDNTYAMKGIGGITGAAGGAASRFATQYKKNMETLTPENGGDNNKWARRIASAGGALGAIPRGVISGGRNGLRNASGEISGDGIRNNWNQGVVGSQDSYRNAAFQRTRANVNDFIHNTTDGSNPNTFTENLGTLFHNQGNIIETRADERVQAGKDGMRRFIDNLTGSSANYSAIQANANAITSGIDSMKKLAESAIKDANDEKSKLERRLETTNDPTVIADIKEQIKNKKAEIATKQTAIYNQKNAERAQMAANLEKLIYGTGFSDTVMQELNAKVNATCSQSLEELLKDFKNQNNVTLTVDQTKAFHSISGIIKQAGTDASLIADLRQSQSPNNKPAGKDDKK